MRLFALGVCFGSLVTPGLARASAFESIFYDYELIAINRSFPVESQVPIPGLGVVPASFICGTRPAQNLSPSGQSIFIGCQSGATIDKDGNVLFGTTYRNPAPPFGFKPFLIENGGDAIVRYTASGTFDLEAQAPVTYDIAAKAQVDINRFGSNPLPRIQGTPIGNALGDSLFFESGALTLKRSSGETFSLETITRPFLPITTDPVFTNNAQHRIELLGGGLNENGTAAWITRYTIECGSPACGQYQNEVTRTNAVDIMTASGDRRSINLNFETFNAAFATNRSELIVGNPSIDINGIVSVAASIVDVIINNGPRTSSECRESGSAVFCYRPVLISVDTNTSQIRTFSWTPPTTEISGAV